MKRFRHAGDLGDIIWSLPVMKWHFDKEPVPQILHIEAASYTRVRLTPDMWAPIAPLLLEQPYIADVQKYNGEAVQVNLNDFRAVMMDAFRSGNRNASKLSLWEWNLIAQNIPLAAVKEPWITVKNPVRKASHVVNRSARYQNPLFPWRRIMAEIGSDAVFIGFEHEHELFCKQFDVEIEHVKTADLLEAAAIIAGCDTFIGNQSCCHAIAEAMKKPICLEVWTRMPNTISIRRSVTHGWDETVKLPEQNKE